MISGRSGISAPLLTIVTLAQASWSLQVIVQISLRIIGSPPLSVTWVIHKASLAVEKRKSYSSDCNRFFSDPSHHSL